MKRPSNYITRQGEAILSYLSSLNGEHVTVERIAEFFESRNAGIGVATIYRHLDKLETAGKVRKYVFDSVSGACYQYVEDCERCLSHFHLKCEDCGTVLHLPSDMISELERSVLNGHSFKINVIKTVLYGKCASCLANA
ncbi:MAG: transcriptional repressor [Clostridiales bacterium]|jgi:Fur family ferric uptake transcriptional regulator|nr:transcriptional repressor [Clostridiales bacterium]